MFIHFSYSEQAIELTYDDHTRKLFSFAWKLGESFSKRKEARDVAWLVNPLILEEWREALDLLVELAAPGKSSARISPWAAHCALNLLCTAGINSDASPIKVFLLLKAFASFAPCLLTTRHLPPLVEIVNFAKFSPLAASLYQALIGNGKSIPLPVDSAIYLGQALLPHSSAHPEIARLFADIEQNTKGVRTAFSILKEKS